MSGALITEGNMGEGEWHSVLLIAFCDYGGGHQGRGWHFVLLIAFCDYGGGLAGVTLRASNSPL